MSLFLALGACSGFDGAGQGQAALECEQDEVCPDGSVCRDDGVCPDPDDQGTDCSVLRDACGNVDDADQPDPDACAEWLEACGNDDGGGGTDGDQPPGGGDCNDDVCTALAAECVNDGVNPSPEGCRRWLDTCYPKPDGDGTGSGQCRAEDEELCRMGDEEACWRLQDCRTDVDPADCSDEDRQRCAAGDDEACWRVQQCEAGVDPGGRGCDELQVDCERGDQTACDALQQCQGSVGDDCAGLANGCLRGDEDSCMRWRDLCDPDDTADPVSECDQLELACALGDQDACVRHQESCTADDQNPDQR